MASVLLGAPDAKVVAIKGCWPHDQDKFQASCNSFTLALAINRAIRMNVDILNLSLAGPPDPLMSRLIDTAIAKGITVIAADPGMDRAGQRFPASMENAIAVGMTQQAGRGKNNSMQHCSIASITAPGINILTTVPQAEYDFVSGCSVAAAHVSGVVALLLEINPDLTPHEIMNLLETTKKQTVADADSGEIDPLVAISKLRELYPSTRVSENRNRSEGTPF